MDAMTSNFPQECSTMKTNTDVQNVFNYLNTPNDVFSPMEETVMNDASVISCQGREGIQNCSFVGIKK
jgi:hypothetical protein